MLTNFCWAAAGVGAAHASATAAQAAARLKALRWPKVCLTDLPIQTPFGVFPRGVAGLCRRSALAPVTPAATELRAARGLQARVCAMAASMAPASRSTSWSSSSSAMMNGGATSTWSPWRPSMVPPIG
ncbi:Uncharacterised protein [Bordetella pertussis]|nr:Uncharacterised protein [Bordetella pertussis]